MLRDEFVGDGTPRTKPVSPQTLHPDARSLLGQLALHKIDVKAMLFLAAMYAASLSSLE